MGFQASHCAAASGDAGMLWEPWESHADVSNCPKGCTKGDWRSWIRAAQPSICIEHQLPKVSPVGKGCCELGSEDPPHPAVTLARSHLSHGGC